MMDLPTSAAGRLKTAVSDGTNSYITTESSAPDLLAFLAHHSHDWL
jgi:hypothetical protein